MYSSLNDDKLILQISLNRIRFLSVREKIFLEKNLDSSNHLALLSIEEIEKILGRSINKRAVWDGKENLHAAEVALHRCKSLGIGILLYSDSGYPEILKQIPDPPYLLFYRGNISILTGKTVSVVGSRRVTTQGKNASRKFGYDASVNGCNVVSGLANGVDGESHQGSVDAYFDYLEQGKDTSSLGKTIAVLPGSIDEIVPAGHKNLASKIVQSGGCLISEYEPGIGMANWHFVARNRIIAGMSPATVVIEAPPGSGSLITADFALENGRDVMFHQCAFSTLAKQVSEKVEKQLDGDFAAGLVSKYKRENTTEKYLEAGAPVISDFKDYLVCLQEVPGKRSGIKKEEKSVQGLLFEEK